MRPAYSRRQFQHLLWTICSFTVTTLPPRARAFAPTLPFSRAFSNRMASTHISSMNANMPISPRICETLDPCVVLMKEMMQEYTHLWQEKGGIFSLAQGVVYWNPPEASQQALIEEIRNPTNTLHTYGPSQGIPELTSALQTKISQENGLNNHSIMVTTGANQAYVNCVLTCLCDSSKAVVFKPYYFNHVMALQMSCGNDSVVVGPCSDEGIPDLDWLEQTLQAQKVDMVTIVNPGNPTGVSLSKDYLQKVVDLCAKHSVWLVLDCTYEYFTIPEHQPIATFPAAPHVIHIFSFSKSYSLAGYRCGYLAMHNESKELWKNMQKVQDTIPIGPARVSQVAALGALQQTDSEWVRNRYHTLDSGREAILSALEPLPRTMGGTGAMYLMGKLPPMSNGQVPDDVEFCRTLVEKYGIAVIPGSFCGFPGWIRVCYANLSPETCQEAANRLEVGIRGILQMPKT